MRLPGVVSAIPVVDGQVLLTDDRGNNSGGYVRGIRQADLESLHAVSDHIRAGSLDDFKGPDAIAIGLTLANRFGLTTGSKITLVSPQGAATAFGTIPRVRAYTVAAVFQVGMNEYDSGYVFLPLEAAQIFFQQAEPGNADRSGGGRPGSCPCDRAADPADAVRSSRCGSWIGSRQKIASSRRSRSSRTSCS